MEFAKDLQSGVVVSTLSEVATFFGVEEQTVRGWRVRSDPMPGIPGVWNLSDIAQWRIKGEKSRKPLATDQALIETPGAEDWKDRWVQYRAQLAAEELGKVKGQLVSIEELTPQLRRTAEVIRDGIRRLEAEFGSDAADIIRTPLERMSEEVEGMVDRDSGNED